MIRRGGLQVRGLERDQTPVADLYCHRCHTHQRVTGRTRVQDFMRANPLLEHRARCSALQKKGTTP
ncbi:transcription factor WhiB [Streptomyces sp. NPDC060194]|uniref:transcription factor WhiB n=1 Tax=Streptomyces sp. NPDC060194 TaxID=3347069 RepID=UPI0036652B96